MRGISFNAGVFSESRRDRNLEPAVPGYLHAYPMAASMMQAKEYDFRNRRNGKMNIINFQMQTMAAPTKPAYNHIRRKWGHVPNTDTTIISRRAERKRLLDEGVEIRC